MWLQGGGVQIIGGVNKDEWEAQHSRAGTTIVQKIVEIQLRSLFVKPPLWDQKVVIWTKWW